MQFLGRAADDSYSHLVQALQATASRTRITLPSCTKNLHSVICNFKKNPIFLKRHFSLNIVFSVQLEMEGNKRWEDLPVNL
jgi:hypothetical protein